MIAKNPLGTVPGPERTFTTFPFVDLVNDPCPNVLARKQTRDLRAARLPRLRARLGRLHRRLRRRVRPGPGPDAVRRLPGRDRNRSSTRSSTAASRARATRPTSAPIPTSRPAAASGWTTRYVGIPADGTPSTTPFGSTPRRADSGLGAFAFAGPASASPASRTARRAFRCACPTAASCRGWRARYRSRAPTRRATSASRCPPTAPTSSSARPRSSRRRQQQRRRDDLRPRPRRPARPRSSRPCRTARR